MSNEIVTPIAEVVQIPDALPMSLRIPGSDAFVHFRPITEFPGYEASSDGRIWSRRGSRHVAGTRGGTVPVIRNKRKPLKPFKSNSGYYQVHVWKDKKQSSKYVHNFVATTFIGERPSPDHHICHSNGNRLDNRAENLRYDTALGNSSDKIAHGTSNAGEKNRHASVSNDEAARVFARYYIHQEDRKFLCEQHGISQSTFSRIVLRRSYKRATEHMAHRCITKEFTGDSSLYSNLTAPDVIEIRRLFSSGECINLSEIARRYGVSSGSISSVVKRETWKSV